MAGAEIRSSALVNFAACLSNGRIKREKALMGNDVTTESPD